VFTRQGWLTAAGGVGLIVAGRLLGSFELFLLGSAAVGLSLVAVLRTALARLDLRVSRHVEPPRVNAGGAARVELRLRNDGARTTPVLRLRDAVSGTRGANLLASPLPPLAVGRAAYLLPTDRRGILHVGPLHVEMGDAFGLTATSLRAAGTTELVVYPHIDRIAALPEAAGRDPQSTARHPNALGRAGDDFYALRPYQLGDDLRRVHWPATAHHDELMIRQHELPWQERTTVLLDVRSHAHHPASFELAVSAAASVLSACSGRGDQVRLATTGGSDSGFQGGRAHLDSCLLHLATVGLQPEASLLASVEAVGRSTPGGALVLVTAALTQSERQRLSGLGGRFAKVVVVLFEPSSWDADGVDRAAPASVVDLVRVTREATFAEAWNRRFAGDGRRRLRDAPTGIAAGG